MSRSKRILPPDSRPIADHELDQADMASLVELQDILSAMRAELPRTAETVRGAAGCCPDHHLFATVDPDRTPRVVLISGPRGTGKTALLLTLLHRWERVACGVKGLANPKMKHGGEVWDDELASACRALPILDFDPMPPGMPLVAWLIRAFEPLVRHLNRSTEGSCGRSEGNGKRDGHTATITLEDRWEKLHDDALDAWSIDACGGQESARGRVRAWNQLRRAWTEFVDALLTAMRKGRNPLLAQNGLLVLPIDDVDMQVTRVPEIVRDLRNLHHPAVVFVVTGHRPLLVEALQLDVDGQRRRLARDMPRSEWSLPDAGETDQMGDRLVQKVFPLGLQVGLDPLPLDQALTWQNSRLLHWLGDDSLQFRWMEAARAENIGPFIRTTRRRMWEIYAATELHPLDTPEARSVGLVDLLGGLTTITRIESPARRAEVSYQYSNRALWAAPFGTIWYICTGYSITWPNATEAETAFMDLLVTTYPLSQDRLPPLNGRLLTTHQAGKPTFLWPDPTLHKLIDARDHLHKFHEIVSKHIPSNQDGDDEPPIYRLVACWIAFTGWRNERKCPDPTQDIKTLVREFRSQSTTLNTGPEATWLALLHPAADLLWPTGLELATAILEGYSTRKTRPDSHAALIHERRGPERRTLIAFASRHGTNGVLVEDYQPRIPLAKIPWELLLRLGNFDVGAWVTTHLSQMGLPDPLLKPEVSAVYFRRNGSLRNVSYYLSGPSRTSPTPAGVWPWSSAAELVGHHITEGGRFGDYLRWAYYLANNNSGGRFLSTCFEWMRSVWNWLTEGSPLSTCLNIHRSQEGFTWNGPAFQLNVLLSQGNPASTRIEAWTLSTEDQQAMVWLEANPSRHFAVASWLGLIASVDADSHPLPPDRDAVHRCVTMHETGLTADLLGTAEAPPLGWAEVDRLWVELDRTRLDPPAPAPLRAAQALRALHLTVTLMGLNRSGQDAPVPIFQADITADGSLLLQTLDGVGLAASPEVLWLKEAVTGILDRHHEAIPATIVAKLSAFASRIRFTPT